MGNKASRGRGGEDVTFEEIRDLGALLPEFVRALKTIGPPDMRFIADIKDRARLTSRHLTALYHLTLDGPQSVSELAARLHVALPTASLLVGELGRAGLIERTEDPADRRRTIVRISPIHATAVDEFLRQRVAPVRRTLAQLDPEDRTTFMRALRLLVDEFTALAQALPGYGGGDHQGRCPTAPSVAAPVEDEALRVT